MEIEEIGLVCVYCGTPTAGLCCGEVHHEEAYDVDGELVLESEMTEEMWKITKVIQK